jgi:hypothetical protein
LMILCLSISTVSFWLYGPVVLNLLHGVSLIVAGYIAVAEAIAWSLAAIIVANAAPSAEKMVIRLGALMIVVSISVLALSLSAGWIGITAAAVICQGGGFGCLWGFTMRRIVEAAAEEQRTITTSAIPTIQRMGYAIGASLSGIVANAAGFSEGLSAGAAQQVAFWAFAAFVPIAGLGLANALRLTSWRDE